MNMITFKTLTCAIMPVVIGAIFSLSASSHVSAQSADSLRHIFVEIQGLTPENYGFIKKSFDLEEEIHIQQACVPAKLIMFNIDDVNSRDLQENFNAISDIISSSAQLSEIRLLAEYAEEEFIKHCASFRMRPTNP